MKNVIALAIVIGLFAVPAMAADDSATANVEINVEAYCEITVEPGVLDMTVDQDQDPLPPVSEGQHQATTPFELQCNSNSSVVLTVDYASNCVIVTPGMKTGDEWPTAYTGGSPNSGATNGIGYGLALTIDGVGTFGWDPALGNCNLTAPPGISTGEIKINSYIDSGRDIAQNNIAAIGLYTGVVTMTVTTF